MSQDIFVDGIGTINVTGNIVRIDLASLQPQLKSENGEPVFATSQRIVMPLEGFLQGVALQQNILQQLIQTGVLQVNAVPAASAEAGAEPESVVQENTESDSPKEPLM